MNEFTKYKRSAIAELRPYVAGEDMAGINVSTEDTAAGSPKEGDMIARNPANNADQWLINAAYFAANFETMLPAVQAGAVVSVVIGDFEHTLVLSPTAMDKVLMNFNVTGDARVTFIKALSAAQIQMMLNHQAIEKAPTEAGSTSEEKAAKNVIRQARMRAASIAITEVELTQMPLVKAFFALA